MTHRFASPLLSAICCLPFLLTLAPAQTSGPELWYFQAAYPHNTAETDAIKTQIDLAHQYGYTGVAFWSSTFTFLGSTVNPAYNTAFLQQLVSYAQSKGMITLTTVTPYGYSDDVLLNNPNWAEGQRIIGSQFTVNAPKTALVPVNSFAGVNNPGFENGTAGWFAWGDGNMGVDKTVAHTGSASGFIKDSAGLSRFVETLNLTPWRQYRGRIWMKTSNFHGFSQIEVYDSATGATRFNTPLRVQATQDWTLLEFTFNSGPTTQPLLLFGVWGGSTGTIWFDDIYLEETSLVYLLRRSGTPLHAYDPANPHTIYTEGKDFDPIADPIMKPGGIFNGFYHTPVTVTLPAGSSLQPGQKVAMDYYAVQPVVPEGDVGLCLTEPGVQNWIKQNAQLNTSNFPAPNGYMLSYDEMRHMNSCALCRARNLSAGKLLAAHVADTSSIYHSLSSPSPQYFWSDMFDPHHNAVNNYYFVEGDLAGSWLGLPHDATIMNWNLSNLTNSLRWFSGLDPKQPTPFRQIIAGYYDSGDGAGAATAELKQAAGIPGIAGLMYTTWYQSYSQMQAFASAAKAGWTTYIASVPAPDLTAQFTVAKTLPVLNRITGRYRQTITLKNNANAVTATAFVLDSLPAGVTLYLPSGTTKLALPAGSPYKEIGPVAAGASIKVTLEFTRTASQPWNYTARLLGPGPR